MSNEEKINFTEDQIIEKYRKNSKLKITVSLIIIALITSVIFLNPITLPPAALLVVTLLTLTICAYLLFKAYKEFKKNINLDYEIDVKKHHYKNNMLTAKEINNMLEKNLTTENFLTAMAHTRLDQENKRYYPDVTASNPNSTN